MTKQTLCKNGFTVEILKHEGRTNTIHKLFQETEKVKTLRNSFNEARIIFILKFDKDVTREEIIGQSMC